MGEAFGAIQQGRRQRQAEGDGLAGAGLGRNQRIGLPRLQNRLLHRRQLGIAAFCQRLGDRRNDAFEICHLSVFRNFHAHLAPWPEPAG